jgi:molybdopterin synthase sulfur carrier subunit
MNVTVKLFATLRKGRFDIRELELPEGTRTIDAIGMLGVPDSEVALIFINNLHAGLDTVLERGDTLALFPPIGGG